MRAVGLTVIALALAPAAARAETHLVGMPGTRFEPSRLNVVVGDEVVFRNNDYTGDEHDVHDGGGAFETGRMQRFASFAHVYRHVGEHPFVCTVHPGMAGNVDVAAALLHAPAEPALAGEPLTLSGRVPTEMRHASVERLATGGWVEVAHAMSSPDGSFTADVRPVESTDYRVSTAIGPSAPVRVEVVSGLRVTTRLRGRALRVRVAPAPHGARVVLERYVRERFGWVRKRAAPLRRGAATFRVRRHGTVRALVLRRGVAAPLAVGAPIRLKDGLPGHDPTAGDRPFSAHGGH